MLDAQRTTNRQRILDMYSSNNNQFLAGASVDLDRATTARPGVYDGVGTWFANTYQPTHGDLTAEKFEEESNGFFSEAMQTDEGADCNNNGKRPLARTLGKGKEKEEPQRKRKREFSACRKDPFPYVSQVPAESEGSAFGFERFAPADVGVHSRTGEARGGNPMELRYYFTNFDF